MAVITVTSAADADPLDAAARDSDITLREALLIANGTLAIGTLSAGEQALVSGTVNTGATNPDQIHFNIPGAGVHTITPDLAVSNFGLPAITDPVMIDGYTQPGATTNELELSGGSDAVLQIAIQGSSSMSFPALSLTGGDSTLRGLSIGGFGLTGVEIRSSRNVIEGCFIGVSADGMTASENALYQVRIATGDDNVVGGVTPEDRNVIAGGFNNGRGGMITVGDAFDSSDAPNRTVIRGNLIGTNRTGTAKLGSGGDSGIGFEEGFETVIGGDDAADGDEDGIVRAGNLISGASTYGIHVEGFTDPADFSGLVIRGNRIGTTADGTAALANGFAGIGILNNNLNLSGGTDVISGFLIGGVSAGAGNLISGNTSYGILMSQAQAVIQGNRIGTNAAGTAAVANGSHGISLQIGGNATPPPEVDIVIGGDSADSGDAPYGAGNLISGNGTTVGNGIWLSGIVTGTVRILGNTIGLGADGTTVIPNKGNGINVFNRPAIIGGTTPGAGNTIAGNTGAGIGVGDVISPPLTVPILGNSIYNNGRLGIDLGGGSSSGSGDVGNGVTPNDGSPSVFDGDEGPNSYQNFPVITLVSPQGGSSYLVSGTLESNANRSFWIELFSNVAADASGYGEGQFFLGQFEVRTDDEGYASFSQVVSSTLGTAFSATATEMEGRATSEFGPTVLPADLPPVDVSMTATASPSTVAPGETVTYTFSAVTPNDVSNLVGPGFFTALPAGTTFVSFTAPDGWTTTTPAVGGTGDVSASAAEALQNSTYVFTLVVRVNAGASDGLLLPASGDFRSSTPDSNTGNNTPTATATVADDEPPTTRPTANVGATSISTPEGDSGTHVVNVPITLTVAPTTTTVVTFRLEPGTAIAPSDYLVPGTLNVTFTPGGPLTQNVAIAVVGDTVIEPDETFLLRVLPGETYGLGDATTSTITIVNDDVETPGGDTVAPTIVSLQRYGYHTQSTALVLTFSEPITAGASTTPSTYTLIDLGRDRTAGTRDDRRLVIDRATLDGSGTVVMLRPSVRLNLHKLYTLQVGGEGIAPITDLAGNALAGRTSYQVDRSIWAGGYKNGQIQPFTPVTVTAVPTGPRRLRRGFAAG
jgi:hypothetical protein